uniref:Uncharacterized protein n=1 Tax=Plectus sambesii TaxID=2011161 RepID=A0A914VQN3_9BILA
MITTTRVILFKKKAIAPTLLIARHISWRVLKCRNEYSDAYLLQKWTVANSSTILHRTILHRTILHRNILHHYILLKCNIINSITTRRRRQPQPQK